MPMQASDLPDTYAVVTDLGEQFHYQLIITVAYGIQRFAAWYRDLYKVQI